jgi:hypothetical protein
MLGSTSHADKWIARRIGLTSKCKKLHLGQFSLRTAQSLALGQCLTKASENGLTNGSCPVRLVHKGIEKGHVFRMLKLTTQDHTVANKPCSVTKTAPGGGGFTKNKGAAQTVNPGGKLQQTDLGTPQGCGLVHVLAKAMAVGL